MEAIGQPMDRRDGRLKVTGTARDMGETGVVGTTAAITNAVYHATGIRHRELPLMPARMMIASGA